MVRRIWIGTAGLTKVKIRIDCKEKLRALRD